MAPGAAAFLSLSLSLFSEGEVYRHKIKKSLGVEWAPDKSARANKTNVFRTRSSRTRSTFRVTAKEVRNNNNVYARRPVVRLRPRLIVVISVARV